MPLTNSSIENALRQINQKANIVNSIWTTDSPSITNKSGKGSSQPAASSH